jgi:hypothetical protein
MTKNITVIMLLLFVSILTFFSYIVSIYQYEWSENPILAQVPNHDSVFVVFWFTIVSIVCVCIAFGLFLKKKSLYTLFFLALILLNIFKLMQVIPVYTG